MVSTSTRLCFAPEGSLVSVRTFTLQPSLEDSLALLAGFGNSEIVTPRNRQLLIRFLRRTACALDQEFMMRQRQHQPFTRGDAARWERIASSFATVDSLAVFVNEALEEMSCLERFTFTEVQLTKLRRADLLPGKHTWATFSPCACADCGGRRVVRWCTDCEACFRCEGKSGGLLCVRAAVDPLSPPTPSPQLAGCSGARGGGGGGGGNVGEEEEEEEEEVGGDWWKTWQQQPSQMKASKSSSGHQMAPNRLAEDTSRILKAGHYSCSSSSSSSNIVRLELPRLGASYRACRTVMATAASEGGNGKKQNKAAPKGAPKGASKGEVACSTHSSAAVVMEVVEEDSFDAALTTMTRESSSLSSSSSSFPPCVLDFASDSKPGGGWRTKQQGTQEESLCRRSSLGCCLEEHHRRVGHAKYMPINAVIYSVPKWSSSVAVGTVRFSLSRPGWPWRLLRCAR